MTINGIEYDDKEMDFTNILCDMEDIGVDIMAMNNDNVKPFTLCRAIVHAFTGEKDLQKCGKILTEHLKNGGTLDDILNPFTEIMNASGFGETAVEETPKKVKALPEK